MITTEVIQIIIQGGAVGGLLAFGWGAYKISRLLIETTEKLIGNHLETLTEAVREMAAELRRFLDRQRGP